MKVTKIKIENCKSYKEPISIDLDSTFNVLVGPNGGGKSNTLDIITIVLRYFFLKEYVVHSRDENSFPFRDIESAQTFASINRFLEPHQDGVGNPARIWISLSVGQSDVENLQFICDHADVFRSALKSI